MENITTCEEKISEYGNTKADGTEAAYGKERGLEEYILFVHPYL